MSKNSYDASTIEVLKGLDPVRKRPGMYIGSTSRSGLNHLIQEIIDNSVDEHLAGFCSRIYVGLNEDGSATISDNGRGLPVEIHPTEKVSATRVIFFQRSMPEVNFQIMPIKSPEVFMGLGLQ